MPVTASAVADDSTEVLWIDAPSVLIDCGGTTWQPMRTLIRRVGPPITTSIRITGEPVPLAQPLTLETGTREYGLIMPPVKKERDATLTIVAGGQTVASHKVTVKPVHISTIYLISHDHTDIGYTDLQPVIERHQWQNLERAMELCRKTADNPPEARFKWNTEVLWAVDSYLRKAPPEKQQALIDAIRAGSIELDALYGNELTGLCRPEELLRLCECSQRLAKRCGVKVEAAMISDVPGYTWGIVPALAQAGVKYFSIGPNNMARIGKTLTTWADKPFYWLGPDGRAEGVVLGSVQRILGGLRAHGRAVGRRGAFQVATGQLCL